MTFTPQTERDRRTRRLKGLFAGVAGVALLLGGTTFAMWSDQDTVAAPSITHGNLDVASAQGAATVLDLRKSGSDGGLVNSGKTAVDPATFLAVPGDQLEIDLPAATITATGNNMKYEIGVASTATSIDLHEWQIKAYVYEGTTLLNQGGTDLSNLGTSGASIAAYTVTTPRTVTVRVALIATLPTTVAGQDHVSEILDLSTLVVSATQTV
jgi:alternate signal-mediated exported protein